MLLGANTVAAGFVPLSPFTMSRKHGIATPQENPQPPASNSDRFISRSPDRVTDTPPTTEDPVPASKPHLKLAKNRWLSTKSFWTRSIPIPAGLSSQEISDICDRHRKLWCSGYSGKKDEREAKAKAGIPPEFDKNYRISISFISNGSTVELIRNSAFTPHMVIVQQSTTSPTDSDQADRYQVIRDQDLTIKQIAKVFNDCCNELEAAFKQAAQHS